MANVGRPQKAGRVTAAMIVRDEPAAVADSIHSVRAVADRLVVLDAGPTGAAGQLARRLGASVLREKEAADFSALRNRMLAQTPGSWVLWLEAGERLEAGSAVQLRRFIEGGLEPDCAYLVWVEIPPARPGQSAQRAMEPRLVPHRVRYAGRVRETFDAAGLRFAAAPGRIIADPSVHDGHRQALRARRELALLRLSEPGPGEPASRLKVAEGEALSQLGQHGAARHAFLDALDGAPGGSPEMLEAYYGLVAALEGQPSDRHWARWVCLDGLGAFPSDAQLFSALGHLWQLDGHLDRAVEAFRAAAFDGTIHPRVWHLAEIRQMAAVALSATLELQGRLDQSYRAAKEALGRFPGSERLVRRLLDVSLKLDKEDEALGLIDALPLEEHLRQPARSAVRGACAALHRQWTRALGLLQAAYVAGYQEPFCLRWLAVTLVVNRQFQAARPVLAQWLEAEPDNREAQRYLQVVNHPADQGRGSRGELARHWRIDPAGQPGPAVADPPPVRPTTEPETGPRP